MSHEIVAVLPRLLHRRTLTNFSFTCFKYLNWIRRIFSKVRKIDLSLTDNYIQVESTFLLGNFLNIFDYWCHNLLNSLQTI